MDWIFASYLRSYTGPRDTTVYGGNSGASLLSCIRKRSGLARLAVGAVPSPSPPSLLPPKSPLKGLARGLRASPRAAGDCRRVGAPPAPARAAGLPRLSAPAPFDGCAAGCSAGFRVVPAAADRAMRSAAEHSIGETMLRSRRVAAVQRCRSAERPRCSGRR
eukprot:365377-Chlamydomonas_euryale.AAC.22